MYKLKHNLLIGAALMGLAVSSMAQTATCNNNGVIESGEDCDLGAGKNTGANGCDSNCKVVTGWTCIKSDAEYLSATTTTNPPPALSDLVKVTTPLNMMDLWRIINNTPASATTPTSDIIHISSKDAEINCQAATIPAVWSKQCTQYNQDIKRFKEFNFTIPVSALLNQTCTPQVMDYDSSTQKYIIYNVNC